MSKKKDIMKKIMAAKLESDIEADTDNSESLKDKLGNPINWDVMSANMDKKIAEMKKPKVPINGESANPEEKIELSGNVEQDEE